MASLTELRQGLADRCDTIDGLTANPTGRGTVNVPAAVIGVETIDYDSTMARGSDDYILTIRLLVAESTEEIGQDALDEYLASAGDRSIKAAVEAEKSLGGVAHFAVVRGVTEYGDIEYGGVGYLGAVFTVEVTASGT